MTLTTSETTSPARPPRSATKRRGWFGALLLRLHFYAGVLVGPFILVAALSGALYALTPQLEQVVYADQLHAPKTETIAHPGRADRGSRCALRRGRRPCSPCVPPPSPATRHAIMYAEDGLGDSESRAVFVDPGTGEIRGDLIVYGTSGSTPLRTWISNLHRSLHLGDVGRLYSELAASWLGIVALAGLVLWIIRIRRARVKKDLIRPNRTHTGYRALFGWHTSIGIWMLLGSAVPLRDGHHLVAVRRRERRRAARRLRLGDAGCQHQPRRGSGGSGRARAPSWTGERTDGAGQPRHVRRHARHRPAREREHRRSRDQAARRTGHRLDHPRDQEQLSDRRRLPRRSTARPCRSSTAPTSRTSRSPRSWPAGASASTWASCSGSANQIVLFLLATGLAAMVVLGYLMWWKRRPVRREGNLVGSPPRRMLHDAPWWGIGTVAVAAGLLGFWLPLVGWTLLGFVILDTAIGLLASRRPGA